MKSRSSSARTRFVADLHRLRDGDLSFNRFAAAHTKRVSRYASGFLHRWRPRGLRLDDLTQEAMIAIWRAVDEWDPERASLIDFVEFRLRRHLRVECERSLGWPCQGRKDRADKPPIRPLSLDSWLTYFGDPEKHTGTPRSREMDPEKSTLVADVLNLFEDFDRDVVSGVAAGAPIKTVAQRIHADDDRRKTYGLGTLEETIRKVRKTVKDAPSRIS